MLLAEDGGVLEPCLLSTCFFVYGRGGSFVVISFRVQVSRADSRLLETLSLSLLLIFSLLPRSSAVLLVFSVAIVSGETGVTPWSSI